MISVIVPIYKVEPYLSQCIDSILKQTYTDFEVLLIDDGSPDRCGLICDEYAKKDTRIRVFHNENEGISSARNCGLDMAKGELISFIDPDDWVEPTMFECLQEALVRYDADISAGGFVFEQEKQKIQMFETAVYGPNEILEALTLQKVNNHMWNKLYRKELFNSVRFPFSRTYEDYFVMHLVVCSARRTVTIPDLVYHYRIREESVVKTDSISHLIDYADATIERYDFCMKHIENPSQEVKDKLIFNCALTISKVWRYWYGIDDNEQQQYADRLEKYSTFAKAHFPFFGKRSWGTTVAICSPFMRSMRTASFAFLYYLLKAKRSITRHNTL